MIEIEGLPEGWKGVAYRRPYPQEYILKSEGAMKVRIRGEQPWLIIERIKPREITLVETDERCSDIYNMLGSYCREVKETEEPKLSLSVDECKEAMRKLETFNVTDLSVKICGFLKENS